MKLEITNPAYREDEAERNKKADKHYVFVQGRLRNSQRCIVPVEGTTGVDSYNSDLKWEITTIEGVAPDAKPANKMGSKVEFTYNKPPKSNDAFKFDAENKERYKITLTHQLLPGEKDERIFRIFYDPTIKNEHGKKIPTNIYGHPQEFIQPNWFYYWKNGGAVSSLNGFEYVENNNYGGVRFKNRRTELVYKYVSAPSYDNPTGRELTLTGHDGIKFKVGFISALPDSDPRLRIQSVRSTCSHENKHECLWIELKDGNSSDTDGDICPDCYEIANSDNREKGTSPYDDN